MKKKSTTVVIPELLGGLKMTFDSRYSTKRVKEIVRNLTTGEIRESLDKTYRDILARRCVRNA